MGDEIKDEQLQIRLSAREIEDLKAQWKSTRPDLKFSSFCREMVKLGIVTLLAEKGTEFTSLSVDEKLIKMIDARIEARAAERDAKLLDLIDERYSPKKTD